MVTDNAGIDDVEWRAARDQALELLRDALEWNLPERRWWDVSGAISDMAVAVSAASANTLWRAVGSLDLCATTRVASRLGDTPPLPAPVAVRDRIADLIDALADEGNREAGELPGHVTGAAVIEADEAGR